MSQAVPRLNLARSIPNYAGDVASRQALTVRETKKGKQRLRFFCFG
jgi:hypothetical protein